MKRWDKAYSFSSEKNKLVDSLHQQKTKYEYLISQVETTTQHLNAMERQAIRDSEMLRQRNNGLVWLGIITLLTVGFLILLIKNKKKQEVLNTKLNSSNQNKDKIIRILTHDIRTPLIDILNILELMEIEVITDIEKNNIVQSVRIKINHLRDNVDAILNWSINQLKGGKGDKSKVFVTDLLSMATGFVSNQALNKYIKINTESIDRLTAVHADANQIDIVHRNILGNAIKYSPNGREVKILTEIDSGYVKLKIVDQGKGISKSAQENILGKAIYSDDPSKVGVGIGLKLIKEYLSMNSGSLSIESEPGQGATFTVLLPKYTKNLKASQS
ncbi:HAMP domain-containing histidine kinase [Bacteroidia bacterium]|nr:HAMP domain-containing histidine kinase [Bacteroidia bacterium]MDB9881517.1 HAMP domain-containing histidine kinase [Bacteroidia bacterium]